MGFREAFKSSDIHAIAKWINENYIGGSVDAERRQRMTVRRDLYEDRGDAHFQAMIKSFYDASENVESRLKVLPYSTVQNITKRIVDAKATVYQQPAIRKVKTGQVNFQRYLDVVQIDTVMMQRNRFENLQNDVFIKIGTRDVVRDLESGETLKVPQLDVVTAEHFMAVPHPLHPLEVMAIVLPSFPQGPSVRESDPHYQVWSDTEMFWLDKNGRLAGSVEENPFGFIPGVLCHAVKPVTTLMNWSRGDDIIDGHFRAVALDVFMLWGQKTGTKLPYTTGDMAATVRGQVMSADRNTEFAEGVTPGVLDLGHDPASLIESSKFSTGQLAINHGIPADIYFGTSTVTSGHQLELNMVGLKEKRREQIPQSRNCEIELAHKASVIFETMADPIFRFNSEGFAIDFGEVEAPQEPLRQMQWRKEAKSQGTRSVIDDILEDNPDVKTRPQAAEVVKQKQDEQAEFIKRQRELNMSPEATTDDPGKSPQENGADNAPRDDGKDKENEQDVTIN